VVEKNYVIACDFDGTIVEHAFPRIGPVIGRAVEILNAFQNDYGCKLILWTCRCGEQLVDALQFCKTQDLHFNTVNSNMFWTPGYGIPKIVASVYIDDRGIWGDGLKDEHGNLTADTWDLIENHIVMELQRRGIE
jgi:hypothetical protein